ncbi:MAG TPA: hypothetical protein VK671_16925, partial [Mucilaginibacter sp.]|nr:hypothetical protein [Mucilaginibacter sp.]
MTNKPYSNTRATLAIAKASFRSILRSPSAVVFSLVFPLIFIVVFANIGGSGVTVDVGIAKTCDTTNPVYKILQKNKMMNLIKNQPTDEMNKNLSKGSIDAILDIKANHTGGWTIYPPLSALPNKIPQKPPFIVDVKYTKASNKGGILKSVLNNVILQMNTSVFNDFPKMVEVEET